MRVGFDARLLGTGRLGISRYIISLGRGLTEIGSEDEFIFFTSGRKNNGLTFPARLRRIRMAGPLPVLFSSILDLSRSINRQKLDIFHSPYPLLPWGIKCGSVVTLHDLQVILMPRLRGQSGWYSSQRPPPVQRALDLFYLMNHRSSLRRAELIICISRATREHLLRLWPDLGEKTRIVYYGLDEKFLRRASSQKLDEIRKKYNLPSRFIFYAGTIIPHKNLPRLISAVAGLRKEKSECRDLKLVLAVHQHPGYPSVEELARRSGAEEAVQIIGFVPHDELPFLYQAAELTVLVSFFEGFGMPPLESMAGRTPVVVSRHSSLPEVVGEGGLFVNPENVSEIAEAISRLWCDGDLRKELGQKGVQQARKFSWDRAARETLAVYKEALK